MFWDENVQIWRTSPSGHLAWHKGCCLITIWVIWNTSAGLGTTCSCLMGFWEFCCFCWFCWMIVASKFSTVSVAVFVAVAPTLGANIMFFANSFVATAGTNTRNATFIKIVHSDLLNKTWIVHQQYENVTIQVSHSSMFKNLYSISKFLNSFKSGRQFKDSWGSYSATGSEITEKVQLLFNTHLDRIYLDMITSFHQPGTGR